MIFEPFLKTRVPIDRLKTRSSNSRTKKYLNAGFNIFGVSVKELPHYLMLKQFEADSSLDMTTTEYYRLVEFADSLVFHKGNHPGKRACSRLIRFYNNAKKKEPDPIEVKAMSNGEFLIIDGFHRASVVAALGHKTISAVIRRVDAGLERLLKMVKDLAYGSHRGSKTLYSPIEHPIFDDWKVLKDRSRWDMIRSEFDWNGKKVLDIGSYTGYFSHQVVKLGAEAIGIETDCSKVEVSKRLNVLLGLNVEFLCRNLFDYLEETVEFDCILFLEVLHWVFIKQGGEQRAKQALQLISASAPAMFFVMRRMRLSVEKIGPLATKEAIAEFVLFSSSYEKVKWLGLSTCGRDVFKFTR